MNPGCLAPGPLLCLLHPCLLLLLASISVTAEASLCPPTLGGLRVRVFLELSVKGCSDKKASRDDGRGQQLAPAPISPSIRLTLALWPPYPSIRKSASSQMSEFTCFKLRQQPPAGPQQPRSPCLITHPPGGGQNGPGFGAWLHLYVFKTRQRQ